MATPETDALAKKHSDALEPTPGCAICEPLADQYYELFHHARRLETERDALASALRAVLVQFRMNLPMTGICHDEYAAMAKADAALAALDKS